MKRKRIREAADFGTPELIKKRLAALGPPRPNWPEPDMTSAESALGVLLWQGYLHPDYETGRRMYEAGVTFAGNWILVYPKTSPQGTLGRLQAGSVAVGVDVDRAKVALRASEAVMARERQVLDAVINCCVYQRVNMRTLDKLRLGLQWLVAAERGRAWLPPAVVREPVPAAPWAETHAMVMT